MTYINIYSLYINTSEVRIGIVRGAEQGTDNSGTEIHFRFPAGPRPAGGVSGEGPGREGNPRLLSGQGTGICERRGSEVFFRTSG